MTVHICFTVKALKYTCICTFSLIHLVHVTYNAHTFTFHTNGKMVSLFNLLPIIPFPLSSYLFPPSLPSLPPSPLLTFFREAATLEPFLNIKCPRMCTGAPPNGIQVVVTPPPQEKGRVASIKEHCRGKVKKQDKQLTGSGCG